ncbi:SWIM zinc finger family protein [Aphelenchoides avenae]|nr:SWIM zinc finger family protein [Aphelenchus avenae]
MDPRELPADDQDDVLDEQEIDEAWVRFAEEEQDSLMAPPHLDDDRLSFEDSERFEDDESFVSESESLNNKWRGWSSRQNQAPNDDGGSHDARPDAGRSSSARIGFGASLAELSARKAAKTLSFDLLENHYQALKPGSRIPDSLLIPILRYCFPDNEEDIRLYRCRIVECSCSCASTSAWCEHVVALCLHRMYKPETVEFRPTIWDSITELEDNKLKKFAQYLLNELPRKYLPVAQRLIDQLRDPGSEINQATGAPDPTAGEHDDVAIWCLDERNLHENIKKILISFVKPSPTVCDVQHLSSAYPPTSDEWNLLMKPLRSREPNALWNLLSIVEEMFKRNDENATILLHAITEHCLAVPQMLTWWYQTSLLRSGFWRLNASCYKSHLHALMSSTQYNAGFLCDHIVQLWRLAALNPRLTCFEKDQLASLLQMYHQTVVRRLWKIIPNLTADHYNSINIVDDTSRKLSLETASFSPDHFPAFLPAMRACYLDWSCDTIRDFISANDLTRLELELTEAEPNDYAGCVCEHPTTAMRYRGFEGCVRRRDTYHHQLQYSNALLGTEVKKDKET